MPKDVPEVPEQGKNGGVGIDPKPDQSGAYGVGRGDVYFVDEVIAPTLPAVQELMSLPRLGAATLGARADPWTAAGEAVVMLTERFGVPERSCKLVV